MDVLLPGATDPVEVAAQRVDLAVVRDEAERVREVPRGEGVGREALVREAERRGEALVLEVRVELARPAGRGAFPCRRWCGARTTARRTRRRCARPRARMAWPEALADDVELALEGVDVERSRGPRPRTPGGSPARCACAVSPRQRSSTGTSRQPSSVLALVGDGALDLARARRARRRVARQEHHAHAVLAGLGQLRRRACAHLLAEEGVAGSGPAGPRRRRAADPRPSPRGGAGS